MGLVALACASCCPTRIVTVSPNVVGRTTYSTTVTFPRTRTTTTTTRVYAADNDISLYLDLQAVGAAFAQSATVEEFERLLNSSSYMLSNLDLNNDGFVDYLRVLETVEGRAHVFLIQAVLAQNIYQDVATLVAEVNSVSHAYVQIIGDPYIYGPGFIIQPVFYTTPLIYTHLYRVAYKPWRSPWYWGHFPSHYRRPAPIYLAHYQSYVHTYMHNHKYCHGFEYAPSCHYPDYNKVTLNSQRNDYGRQYPERSFTVRNANTPAAGSVTATDMREARTVVNARDIRERVDAASTTTTYSTRQAGSTASSRQSTGSTATTSRSAGTSTAGTTSTRQAGSSTTSARSTGSRSSQTSVVPQTTVKSRVNTSGTSSTRTSTVSSNGDRSTVRRGSEASQRSASAPVRSSSSTVSSSTRSGSSASSTRTGTTATGRR